MIQSFKPNFGCKTCPKSCIHLFTYSITHSFVRLNSFIHHHFSSLSVPVVAITTCCTWDSLLFRFLVHVCWSISVQVQQNRKYWLSWSASIGILWHSPLNSFVFDSTTHSYWLYTKISYINVERLVSNILAAQQQGVNCIVTHGVVLYVAMQNLKRGASWFEPQLTPR